MPADDYVKRLVQNIVANDPGIIAANLSPDPRPGVTGPAVLPFALSTIQNPPPRCITFHLPITSSDRRFQLAGPPGTPAAPVEDTRLDFAIWTGPHKDDRMVSAVASRLELLFENQSFALAAGSAIDGVSAANVFRTQYISFAGDLGPDPLLKWYWAVMSFLMRIQRGQPGASTAPSGAGVIDPSAFP